MKMEELFKHTFKSLRQQIEAQRAEGCRWWQQRMGTASDFCRAMVANGYLTDSQVQQAAQRYRLGVSRDGAVIFWQIDDCGLLRDGKIMHYRPDCHRDHDRKPTWATYLMRKSGRLPEYWNADHCLFGLHPLTTTDFTDDTDDLTTNCTNYTNLAAQPENNPLNPFNLWSNKTIAVVEAEKTAVIMSAIRPEYLWLATGGKTELSVARLSPLQGRRIILFPDTDTTGQTYRDWYAIAEAAASVFGHPVTVSSILEQRATAAQRAAKIDIADLLFPNQQ